MSQASDLIAEVKSLVADVTKEIKHFEGDFGELGHFTDLAHMNIAKVHLGELKSKLENRRSNADDAELAELEAAEAAEAAAPVVAASDPVVEAPKADAQAKE